MDATDPPAARIELWRRALATPELVREAVAAEAAPTPAGIAAVRRRAGGSPELARAALHIAEGRRRLRDKWTDADAALADPAGAQMASSSVAARWKAARFARVAQRLAGDGRGPSRVLDLCCGIGGDLRELVAALGGQAPVEGLELDPFRAWTAGANSPGATLRVADVTEPRVEAELPAALVHVDPARRELTGTNAQRRRALEELTPDAAFLERVAARALGVAIKLAPSVSPEELPPGELEILSEDGRLTQGVLWTGCLSEDGAGIVRATRLMRDASEPARTLAASAVEATAAERDVADPSPGGPSDRALTPGVTVWSVDPAIERVGLLGVLAQSGGSRLTHPGAGLLIGGQGPAGWTRGFRVLAREAWRRDRLRELVRALSEGGGVVEVKTRGRVVDADQEQRALRPPGRANEGRVLTVFIQRLLGPDAPVEALVCERV